MIQAAKEEKLKTSLQQHLEETKEQVKRLEKFGKILDMKFDGKECEGMKGLLKEGEEVMKLKGNEELIDKTLISGARKVEHYEIIGYKSLIMLAKQIRSEEAEKLLKQNLDEEEVADTKLTVLSKSDEAASAMHNLVSAGQQMFS
jgi:ferritin-like metal-binding protein YciE